MSEINFRPGSMFPCAQLDRLLKETRGAKRQGHHIHFFGAAAPCELDSTPEPLVMVPEDGPSEAPIGVLVPADDLLFEFASPCSLPLAPIPP